MDMLGKTMLFSEWATKNLLKVTVGKEDPITLFNQSIDSMIKLSSEQERNINVTNKGASGQTNFWIFYTLNFFDQHNCFYDNVKQVISALKKNNR